MDKCSAETSSFCLLILIMLLTNGASGSSDAFVTTEPNVHLQEGIDGVIPCHISREMYAMHWTKGLSPSSKLVISLDMYLHSGKRDGPGFDSGRFDVRDVHEDFSLIIKNVKKEDEGVYVCGFSDLETGRFFNSYTNVTVVEQLQLNVKQCNSLSVTDSGMIVCNLTLPEDQTHLVLDCTLYNARGKTLLSWTKDGTSRTMISSASSHGDTIHKLTITMKEDMGKIQQGQKLFCVATCTENNVHKFLVLVYKGQQMAVPTSQNTTYTFVDNGASSQGLFGWKLILVITVVFLVIGLALYLYRHKSHKYKVQMEQEDTIPLLTSKEDQDIQANKKTWAYYPGDNYEIRQVEENSNFQPITIPKMFSEIKNKYPNRTAISSKDNNTWKHVTYKEYWKKSTAVAKSLKQLGLDRFDVVGIAGSNSQEWLLSYMGTIFAGGIAVGINTLYNEGDFWYVVDDCKPFLLMVDNFQRAEEILEDVRSRSYIKHVVYWDGLMLSKKPNVKSWMEFLDTGKSYPDDKLDTIMNDQKAEDCCALAYTNRKRKLMGAMFSHDNFTWITRQCVTHTKLKKVVLLSIFPLSNVIHHVIDIFLTMFVAGTVHFVVMSDSKDLLKHLKSVRPTVFFAHSRAFHEIHKAMELQLKSEYQGSIQRTILHWATKIGYDSNIRVSNGMQRPWGWKLADIIVFRMVKRRIGLDRCTYCVSSGDQLATATLNFFLKFDMQLYEAYSSFKTTGPMTATLPGRVQFGSVGKPFPGFKISIRNPDVTGNGEILFYGRNLFIGYLNQEEETKKTLADEDWFSTGDYGYLDNDGYLYITGRKIDFIETNAGFRVHAVPIETKIMQACSIISHCILIGNDRDYICMLVTLREETDKETAKPTGFLVDEVVEMLRHHNPATMTKTVSEAIADEDINILIQQAIDDYNQSVRHVTRIKKWIILDRDFSVEKGELSPTSKQMIRYAINRNFKTEIDSLY